VIHILQGYSLTNARAAAMFAERKRLFVDLLGWDVPVVDGCFEVDQFDGDDAVYLIAGDGDEHMGSLRLLPTTGPHILGELFPQLCDHDVPRGPETFEITRLCLRPRLGAGGRLRARNHLISAMVDHALHAGISGLTGVVGWDFLEQVMAMGWRCQALGRPLRLGGTRLGAFRVEVDARTPERLAAKGIYVPGIIAPCDARNAA